MGDLSIASQPILKKIMPRLLILSITVLSFLFSYRSSTLSYYKNLHCFVASFKIVASHAMSKNYLFLICNGLFILLAKNSSKFVQNDAMNIDAILQKGFICDGLDEVTKIGEDDRKSIGYEYKRLIMEPNKENNITGEASLSLIAADEGCLEKENEGFHDEMHGKEIITCEASVISISTDEKEFEGFHEEIMHGKDDIDGDENEDFHEDCREDNNQEIHESGQNDYKEEKEEKEVKGHMETLSTEELNKKCDDFIKRMKEEFRIGSEAQHQQLLVIVK